MPTETSLQLATVQLNRVREEIGKIIVGQQDVVDGVKAAKVAAYIGDMNKYPEKGRERDKEMSKARRDLNWQKQFDLALFPEDARAIRASRTPEDEDTCTMCGDFCASRGASALFRGDLKGDKV